MGGAESEVSDASTSILLESANFNNISIRRTSNALKMKSEASSRFDKGLSPELSAFAARRATKLIVELAGGRAAHGILDVYPGKAPETRIEVRRSRIQQVLGIDPPTSRVRERPYLPGLRLPLAAPEHLPGARAVLAHRRPHPR